MPAFLNGCYLSKAVGNNFEYYDQLFDVADASYDGQQLTIDYTVSRTSDINVPPESGKTIRKCDRYEINDRPKPILDHELAARARVLENLDFPARYDYNIFYHGADTVTKCIDPIEKNSAHVNITKYRYSQKNLDLNNFIYMHNRYDLYFVHRTEAHNEIHILMLENFGQPAVRWYAPLLVLTLPVALTIDIVTFPIQSIIFVANGGLAIPP